MLYEVITHGIAGLADEYYTSEVPYENYFNLNIEPWQPNITTLIRITSYNVCYTKLLR